MPARRLPGQNVPIRPFGRTPGEIAWAIVPNQPRRDWTGRPRPVLIVGVRRGDRVIVIPFTSRLPRSGRKRQIVDLAGTGLRPPVWIWDATVAIGEGEIGEHLGWINRDVFGSLSGVDGLTPGRLQQLQRRLPGRAIDGGISGGGEPDEGPTGHEEAES
jgi:hypothetical protein